MIGKQEVMAFSREFGLRPDIIEKDYVLGWLIAGIFNHDALAMQWVFKGGTCLKKCFFETYRFSEDLDFTVTDPGHIGEAFLTEMFTEISAWVYDRCGIEIPKETFRFEVYENPRGHHSVEGRIEYRGPMQQRGSLPRIKLDITDDEALVLEPIVRGVHHPYSDSPPEGIQALCYAYEELFAEKIRALAERERPRDLYDVIHLYRHSDINPDRSLVRETLESKCRFKGIAVPTAAVLENKPERVELEAEWANMLAHQLPVLPPFDQFWRELPQVFAWLSGEDIKIPAMPYPVQAGEDSAWRPPSWAQSWDQKVPLEMIRFAAANHLCVDLAYQRSQRRIEPYSLRRTKDGHLLLHAIRHDSGEHRAYRVDRIEGASVTDIPFVPKYAIELTPSVPTISAP
ncbi:MAG: nucleotidyl transferase AbiEii/AbiGii toxin family protein [Deltaproteobacteria bacterium]|nr:nucleotidyl transferase AbiEii/AbiGii toxin family protein [Deltaproteobacteria bacterium]